MRQFWIHFKTEVRALLKQWPQFLGGYLLVPLFFSILMGFSFDTAFVPEASIDPIPIHLHSEDQGEAGQQLVGVMESGELSEVFELVEVDEADFQIRVEEGYSDNLADTLITIETLPNVSSTDKTIITQFITQWQQALVDQQALAAEIDTIDNPETVEQLIISLEEVANITTDYTIDTVAYNSDTALTSNQFTAISGFIFLLSMSLSSSVAMSTKKEFKGLSKRIGILPLSTTQTVIYDVLTNTIIFAVISSIYMVAWRFIDPTTFIGNPLIYFAWILVYSLFFQVLNTAMAKLFSGKWVNILYQVILMSFMIFGFLPIDKMIGGQLGEFFSTNFVRQIFNQPLYDYMLTQQPTDNISLALGLLVTSLMIIFITIRIRYRKEMQTA